MQRLRIHYAKTEPIRYTSNLDVHKIWERTLRRARLPLAYSQGFHPQPKINQACPLPLGMLSEAEMIDIWLDPDQEIETVYSLLAKAVPPGIELRQITPIDLHSASLPTLITSSKFFIQFLEPFTLIEIGEKVARICSSATLPRQWRGKDYDLRPLIEEIEIIKSDTEETPSLFVQLSAREGATGRPEELLSEMGIDPFKTRIQRRHLILKTDNE